MTTKQKPIDWRVLVAAIIGLVVIECYALSQGINGTVMTGVVAVIGLIAGVAIPFKTK